MRQAQHDSKGQDRWNQYGVRQLQDIKENPDRYIIRIAPIEHWTAYKKIMSLLDPLPGKRLLELGCGLGHFSVFLAQQGAKVTGLDLGPDLISAATALAELNHVDCEFRQGNITAHPFESNTFDTVIGLSVLHHLSMTDVPRALQEASRVLKANGVAIFYEPIENSKLFAFVQNLFPAGDKGSNDYRPSILQRAAWDNYMQMIDDRDMTNQELSTVGKNYFRSVSLFPYGFLIRLERLIGRQHHQKLVALDAFLFKIFPPMRYFNQGVLVAYWK